MRRVKITKIATINVNPNGIDDAYWAIGTIVAEPTVGNQFTIYRESNIHKVGHGVFKTSLVVFVTPTEDGKIFIKTENGEYSLENHA